MNYLIEAASKLLSLKLKEAATSPLIAKSPEAKNFEKLSKTRGVPANDIEGSLDNFYNRVLPELTKRQEKLMKLLKKYASGKGKTGNAKILTGIKPLASLKSKVLARSKPLSTIGDLVRGALLFEYNEDVEEFVKDFRRKQSGMIKDYEVKDKGKDTTFGYYGSHHFDLEIDGLVVELQVMTKKLWAYKGSAHEIYNKWRDVLNTGGVPSKGDQAMSKKIFAMGNKSKYRKENTEDLFEMLDELMEANEILSERIIRSSELNKLFLPKPLAKALKGLEKMKGVKQVNVNDSTWAGTVILDQGEVEFVINPDTGNITAKLSLNSKIGFSGSAQEVIQKITAALGK